MKIVFMGTPEFAVGALEALILAGHEITAVVTQPDKPKGRGKELQFPAVKECALKYGIPVFQPAKIKMPEAVSQLKTYEADIYVVAAFGQILSKEILEIPPLGCVNIHASLLPKYRGAAPIQWAIIDGETKSGVTIMQMNEGLDTGDMLYVKEVEITSSDTAESLSNKLIEAGAQAIVEALPLLEAGKLMPVKQDDSKSCYAKMLQKSMGRIDWNRDAEEIHRLIRGLTPWPSAYTYINGKQLKIFQAALTERSTENPAEPGVILQKDKDSVTVQTGRGTLRIESVQMEGKKRMSMHDFLLGYALNVGDRLPS